jgi:hypothetical protein
MQVKTIRDVLGGRESAEIRCMVTGKVVRKLTLYRRGRQPEYQTKSVYHDQVEVNAITQTVIVPADTPLGYTPWVFDRGNITFPYNGGTAKLCGEGDHAVFRDNDTYCVIYPHDDLRQEPK